MGEKPEIQSVTKIVKEPEVKEILDVAREQKRAIKRGFFDVAKEKGKDLRKRLAVASDKTLEKLPFNLGKKLKPGTEIAEEHIKTQESGVTILEKYLGEYRQQEGKFVGGVEAKAQEVWESNQAFLDEFKKTGQLGYQDFGTAVTKLFDVRDIHKNSLKETDEDFRRVNDQGQRVVNLTKLETKEKRLDWIAKSFGVSAQKAEALWDEAYSAKHGALATGQTKEKVWTDLINNWKEKGVGRSEQIVVLGLLQITNANGIENFLAEGRLKDKENRNIAAFSLGGEKLKKLQTQYYELATSFLTSVSKRGEHLLWDPGRGIVIANISLRDRTVVRDATDVRSGKHVKEEVEIHDDVVLDKVQTELTQFLLTERSPDYEGSNPWDEFMARAEFETAYWQRYRGTVDVKDRYTKEAHTKAAFDEVASAQIIKEHWFERITGFREAVAKYTLAEGDDKNVFDQMMEKAKKNGNEDLIQRLEDAETYAHQFLEMCGAPVDGRETKRDFTMAQLFDATVSSKSGPVGERINDPGGDRLRQALGQSAEKKTYRHKERTNEETGEKEVVFYAIPGLSGEVTVRLEDRKLLEIAEKGGGELFAYLMVHGLYKEAGYWPEWEKTVGPGFSAYLRDGVEHATGYLSRTNLGTYQKREIGRRLGGELYDGSQQHKRFFIQFLLERKQEIKGSGWEESFQQETGTPFDPLNNYHLTLLAKKLGIKIEEAPPDVLRELNSPLDPNHWGVNVPDEYMEKLVSELANPDKWGLFFNPLNEKHMNRIDSSSRELGFHRFFLNVLWAFDATTELRKKSSTMVEMGVNGVKYTKEEGWTGLTVEKLMEMASEGWQHCKPNERLEAMSYLAQRVNEAYTYQLTKMIKVRNSEVTVKTLDNLFKQDFWKVARLTPEEENMVLNEGVFNNEKIELTAQEIQEGRTILGKAMEMKGKRMRFNLYTMLYQSMYLDLVAQPSVPLDNIWALRWQKGWFERCVPDLSNGELQRLKKNPVLFALMPFDDINTYDFIEEEDPRYNEMVDKVLGVLVEPASQSIKDQLKMSGIDARAIDFKNSGDFSRRGWYLGRVVDRMGITNLATPDVQFKAYARALNQIEWVQKKGRYVGLPHCVIEFARDKYRLDITDVQAVEKVGGQQFLDQFTEIVRDSRRLLHINYGIPVDPRTWPADYVVWYKWTLGPLAGGFNEDKEYNGPNWWQDIPAIIITDNDGHEKKVCPAITYKDALRGLHRKWEREPLFGPWPYVPIPHVERDRKAIMEDSFLDCEEVERNGKQVLRIPIGKQLAQVVDWMQELADLTKGTEPSASLTSRFYPQVERYALTFMRTINVDGKKVFLNELNIRQYMPQVTEEFKKRMTADDNYKRGNYNLGFAREFLTAIYGLDFGGVDQQLITATIPFTKKKLSAIQRIGNKGNELSDIVKFKEALSFRYGTDTGDSYNFKTFTQYIEYLRDSLSAELVKPEASGDPPCWKGENRVVSRWYLRNLADELLYGVEGPSVLYELIDTAMERNFLFYTDIILKGRSRWFGMSGQEKKALLNKLNELANPETVLLNDEEGIKRVEGVYKELKRYGFKTPAELAVFVGALQVHDKGLEKLRTLLFTNNPWELQRFLSPDTHLKSLGDLFRSIGSKEFEKTLRLAIPKEGLEFLSREKGKGIYYAQRYESELGPGTIIKPFLKLLGEDNPLLSIWNRFEESGLYPKQSFRMVLLPTLFFTKVGPELITAIQGLTSGSFGVVATSIQKIFEIPGAAANFDTYWKGLQILISNIPVGEAIFFYFGVGIALNILNEFIISPLLALRGIHAGSKEDYQLNRAPAK